MSSTESEKPRKNSKSNRRRPPPPSAPPPDFNHDHFTTHIKEMPDKVVEAPVVQERAEKWAEHSEQSESQQNSHLPQNAPSFRQPPHQQYPGQADSYGYNRDSGVRPTDHAPGPNSERPYYPNDHRPYENRPYEQRAYHDGSERQQDPRLLSSSSEFVPYEDRYNRDPNQPYLTGAWGGGHRMQQRVQQRHHAQAPLGVYNLDGHPPPYMNQRYPQPSYGQPQYHQHPHHHYHHQPRGNGDYMGQAPPRQAPSRRPPPQEPAPGNFTPYVDSDFVEGNVDHQKKGKKHALNDMSVEEVLGENKPSKVSVSVTSLPSSTHQSNSSSEDNEDDEDEERANNGDDDNSSIGSNDQKKYPDIHAFDVKPRKLEAIEGKENSNALRSLNTQNTLSPNTKTQLEDFKSPQQTTIQQQQQKSKVALVAPTKKVNNKSSDSRVQKKPKTSAAMTNPISSYSKCLIMRDRKGMKNRMNPTYNLYSQDVAPGAQPELIMVAQKQTGRTPNYRFYDLRNCKPNQKLNKNSSNYIGKLRGNFNRDEYTAYGVNKEVKGAVVYDKAPVLTQMIDGALPRKMGVLLPLDIIEKLNNLAQNNPPSDSSEYRPTSPEDHRGDNDEETKSDEDDDDDGSSSFESSDNNENNKENNTEEKPFRDLSPEERLAIMMDRVVDDKGGDSDKPTLSSTTSSSSSIDIKSLTAASQPNIVKGKVGSSKSKSYLQLTSKEPVYEKNSYRLNFHGRVKLPSVKNYQLIQPTDIDNVWTQFGKVTEDRFHLDFKEPLDTFLAFAVAISQFDY